MKTSLDGSYNFQASQKSFQINRVKNSRNLNNFLEVRGSHGQISANLLHSSGVFHLAWRKMILCRVGCRGMFDPVSCLSAVLFFLSVSKDTRMQTCVRILGSCQVPVIEFLFPPNQFTFEICERTRSCQGHLVLPWCRMSRSVFKDIPFTAHLEARR